MKGKNLFLGLFAFGLGLFPSYKAMAQSYDSLKTVEVAKELQKKGFNLKGTMVNDPFQIQVDYGGNSKLINTQIFAEKSKNENLMIYPIFVAFNKNNVETQLEKSFVNGYGGFGFIMDDNNLPPSVYADSIASLLKGKTTGVDEKTKKNLVSKLSNVYPNPSNGMINVVYNLEKYKPTKFGIYDVLGRKVYSFEGKPGKNVERINTTNFSSGTYFLKMDSEERGDSKIKKFIILK